MKNVTYINAGAGSGKTYTLTKILTELIEQKKVRPEEVILTTFTTKAASEFKEKAKSFLFERGLYEDAIRLDQALIGTVHSVCQRMIGKYWFALGLSPNMGVMAEEDTDFYISQSLAELPTEEELKMLHEFCLNFDYKLYVDHKFKGTNWDFWKDDLKQIIAYSTNYELEDYADSEERSLAYIRQFVKNDRRLDFTYEQLVAILDEHQLFLEGQKQNDTNDKRLVKMKLLRKRVTRPTIGWYNDLCRVITALKKRGPLADDFATKAEELWTSKLVYEEEEKYIRLIFELARRWRERYAQFKREKNLLDYNDMEKYMRQLMEPENVKEEIKGSFRYLFVDEFQDSSPIQVKIFDALSDLMEHSYWVGDYKQAIYGFRGSDIALTKAVVDRVALKKDGCDTRTLDTSWRSLPDIVEVNNDVFCKTFANVLPKENIHLNQHRKNEHGEDSLRYFNTNKELGIPAVIAKLVINGAAPNEIAVLARSNEELASISAVTKDSYGIPTTREEASVKESVVWLLMANILRYVGSQRDLQAKATIAFLTEEGYDTRRIIEEKLLVDGDIEAKDEEYLCNVPIIKQLDSIRDQVLQQSIATMVESIIIGVNLYDVMKRVELGDISNAFLQVIINTARAYEEHCIQMNLPATIEGFISYLEQVAPVGQGDVNGVQLHTYHSCKGLQWKYVILTSLGMDVDNVKKTVSREIMGVHVGRVVEPSVETPSPEIYIRVTPSIYGLSMSADIESQMEETRELKLAHKAKMEESNRLLYVGMTRPQDVLLLENNTAKRGDPFQWFKDMGLNNVGAGTPSAHWDMLGVGRTFSNYSVQDNDLRAIEQYMGNFGSEESNMRLVADEPAYTERALRYLSPSGLHEKAEVVAHHDFGVRIPLSKTPDSMSTVGDCIHQIFAGIEEHKDKSAYQIPLEEIIENYGLAAVLKDPTAITAAWERLHEYLTTQEGPAVKIYHERPFRLDMDGQTIVGSIDLVWQTTDGDILVDFKTCPMGPIVVLDPTSEHYAGWYAGQLNAYQTALEAAGEKVVKRYIYYPVSGLLVEVGK